MFQSAPGLLAGRYNKGAIIREQIEPVSIRSRLISREIRWPNAAPMARISRFNPLPAY